MLILLDRCGLARRDCSASCRWLGVVSVCSTLGALLRTRLSRYGWSRPRLRGLKVRFPRDRERDLRNCSDCSWKAQRCPAAAPDERPVLDAGRIELGTR